MIIDPKIAGFYNQSSEETRLQLGLGPLEFERNKDLIARYLPQQSGSIADIGGGTGHYALWMAELGHNVTLVDPVEKHLQQAEKRSRKSKNRFTCLLGEARELPFGDSSVDVVILHGPLYHLQRLADRLAALTEASRVLKPGGRVLGFAINYAASAMAALQSGLIHNENIFAMCRQELLSGEHTPPNGFPGMLTEAFFHRPSGLINEFKLAGLQPLELLAVEGMGWMDNKYFESWATPVKRQTLLQLIKLTEADPELLCFSPHMMLAAQV